MEELKKLEEAAVWPKPKLFKLLLICMIVFLLFSLLSPILFTQFSSSIDFSKSQNIGDSISIMNPFVTLISVFLTFLVFKTQVYQNKKQIEIFNLQAKNSKISENNRVLETQKENFDMLTFDLDQFILDVSKRVEGFNEFVEYSENTVFNLKPIQRTSVFFLNNIFQNDRKLVYQYLKLLNQGGIESNEWISKYRSLYSIIGSIPEYLNDIYRRSDLFLEGKSEFFIYSQNETRAIYQQLVAFNNSKVLPSSDENLELKKLLKDFFISYEKIVEKPLSEKTNEDIFPLLQIFSDFEINFSKLNNKFSLGMSDLIIRVNDLVVTFNNNKNEIIRFKDSIKSEIKNNFQNEDSILKKLQDLKIWLSAL